MATNKPRVVIGRRPKHIIKEVPCTMADGTKAAVTMTYIYRTRTEFGALVDEQVAEGKRIAEERKKAADAAIEAGLAPPPVQTMTERMHEMAQDRADYILKIAEGWDLDAPFNAENVFAVSDGEPAVAQSIIDAYRDAVIDGQLGN